MAATTAHIDTFVIDRLPPADQWPDLIFSIPEVRHPERLNAAAELLDSAVARGWGDRPCVTGDGIEWTYADLQTWANRLANVLVDDCGIVPGNRVLLRAPNTPWLVAAWFAVLKAGGVVVATMPLLRASELRKIHDKSLPTVALCDAALDAELNAADLPIPALYWGASTDSLEARAEAKPATFANVDTAADDPALLGFTSGTTGEPKAAIHFHRDLLVIADTFQPLLKATADDIFCGSPPLGFVFGLGGLVVFPMRVGASTQLCSAPGIDVLADLIAQRQATICFTAPTAYRAMLDLEGYDLSSLRRCVSAGETLPQATWQAFFDATGVKLIDGLGATELLHIFVSASDDDIRPGTTGRAVPGYEARVIDDDGNPVADGTVGHLAVRGPIGCRYLDDDRQQVYVQDGWNLTGDAYLRDEDGYFVYQARTDDMIISAGYNIAAPEVEHALLTHPAVAEAGVIGQPDAHRGNLVRAFVHLRDPGSASDDLARELQDHVKATIAPYKYPRQITFVAEPLPKTQTGKLQRYALRGQ
ncbi:MAG: AMP-binding protein [Actinomycetia bacterium]|nr:AMP-binding protein [Actinomycetes bacterium]